MITHRKPIHSIIWVILIQLSSFGAIAQYDSIYFDGQYRSYLLHLPVSYSETSPHSLLIAMHGGFGSAFNMESQSLLSLKADNDSFIVVYPEGIKGGILNIRTWNAGWCCGYASTSNVDDVGFIDALLDALISAYSIDENRIYATGMSNGGFMSYRLACELSDRIAAIAPVASSMSMHNCLPERPVPIISFHSYLDSNVPFEGGIGTGFSNHYNAPQDSVLNSWSVLNGCLAAEDTLIHNNQITKIRWAYCDCKVEIVQFITQDGGHSWPGGTQTVIGDPISNYVNANDEMWEFFKQHTLDCPSSKISYPEKEYSVSIYPNPANDILNISIPEDCRIIEISIFNIQGQKVITCGKQKEIYIGQLAEGVYFLNLHAGNHQINYKIIKLE